MTKRADFLINSLMLSPHPEGGYYKEIYRSPTMVTPDDHARPLRCAITAIYFLLLKGQKSRWHMVLSDEIWTHLEGDALDLYSFDAKSNISSIVSLGKYSTAKTVPLHVVPAGIWQAAAPKGDYALFSCQVAPGFEFDDFRMATDDADIAQLIRMQGEEFSELL